MQIWYIDVLPALPRAYSVPTRISTIGLDQHNPLWTVFPGNSEVATLMRQHDWSTSPLGPPSEWPGTLRSLVALMLQSTFPMFVAWGAKHRLLYNDAYAVLMQDRHPSGLGRPFREVWHDVWDDCLPLIQRAYAGQSVFVERFPLVLLRHGRKEQTYFTFSHSPARDDNGEVVGLFCTCTETTSQVLIEQRQAQLLQFTDQLRELKEPQEALTASAAFLGEHLSLDRVSYLEIDEVQGWVRRGTSWLGGRVQRLPDGPLEDCLSIDLTKRARLGKPFLIEETSCTIEPSLAHAGDQKGTGSCLVIPLVKGGQLTAMLNLTPARDAPFTEGQILFAADVAERAWAVADRAHAEKALTERIAAEASRMRDLFQQSPGFMAVVRGPDHVYEMANASYTRVLGDRSFIGRSVREVFPDIEGQGFYEILDEVYASGRPFVAHEVALSLQGLSDEQTRTLFIDFVLQPIVEPDGSVSGIFIEGNDVTERIVALEKLKISEKRLTVALEAAGGCAWDWDIGNDDMVLSDSWQAMTGYTAPNLPSTFTAWKNLIHPGDLRQFVAELQDCIAGRTSIANSECRLKCQDGSWKWVLNRGTVADRDDTGRPLRIIGVSIDISEKKRSEQQIWHRANYDALTGLPNRTLFIDRLHQEVMQSARQDASFVLMFIDLDHFKEVNDLLGHSAGDEFLKEAAKRIIDCTRGADTVARLGGDEFTVILSSAGASDHAELVAQKILDQLAKPFQIDQEVTLASASIGITLYPQDATDPGELLKNADQSMYSAKRGGRNRFAFFSRSMQKSAAKRLRMITELRQALPNGEFCVYFQPIIDLSTGRISKAEALIRWRHPSKGFIPPSVFIPLAEETGMIHEIGDWVFVQAADCAQRWSRQLDRPFQVSVNRSPLQFMPHSLSSSLNWAQYLSDIGAAQNSVSVEITEGVLLNASPMVQKSLNELHEAGIQVAIDDFGTGYSSMAYLKKYDIDFLKIDQSFIRDMATDKTSQTIAETIIVMAHKLGLKVIAEGVETAQQRDWLQAAGCEYAQGFLFAEALPSDNFEALLSEDRRY